MSMFTIRSDLRPGDLGRLISLHGEAYEGENGSYGAPFEAHVAGTVAEFMAGNQGRGRLFFAEDAAGSLVGTSAMIERRRPGAPPEGQLRWVVLSPAARGRGVGGRLVDAALLHARQQGYPRVYLETTAGLDTSMALYRHRGFEIVGERRESLWRGDDLVITMALEFGA